MSAKPQPKKISPPAWGWPDNVLEWTGPGDDFPTRVGMARGCRVIAFHLPRFPHPRGDGPGSDPVTATILEISPPAWGWPELEKFIQAAEQDFPTRVGMARN